MNTALRDGLVEVPGGLPTFASAGLEARAALIGRIAADSYAYIAGLLGFSPETHSSLESGRAGGALLVCRHPSRLREPAASAVQGQFAKTR